MTGPIALGVDVGGTKIALVAVDLSSGDIVLRDEIPTLRNEGGGRVLNRLQIMVEAATRNLSVKKNCQPIGLGIGVPELVDNAGTIKSSWNFDWDQRDIAADLSEFGPVVLESDARTVALAEAEFGHGKDHPSFLFVTVGSGLSYSFYSDGKIHRGANGYAIHFASSEILAVCGACGALGGFTLESLACGRGLSETYQRRTGRQATAYELLQANAGSAEAELIEQAAASLGSYLGQLINIFDPHALIVGGGLGSNESFFGMLSRLTRPHIWAPDCRELPILRTAIPKDGAAIGAALLLRQV